MVVSCSDNPNNHNHLKHCIAKLQLRVELMHSVVQRQQWQAKSIMEWSLRQLQMYLNAKHIVYKTIYGYLGIPDSGNWSSNNDLLLYRSPPSPSGGSWGQKSRVTRHDRSREMHTQSVTKITLRVCKYFLPHFFILWLAGVHTPGHTQDVGQGVVNGPNKHSKRSHLSWQV